MKINGFIIKKPSKKSKGIIYLGDLYYAATIPREIVLKLQKDWYFFWYHTFKVTLDQIPHNDLINVFVCWDDIREELKRSERRDYLCISGGKETFVREDLLFSPKEVENYEYDLIYISRYSNNKRSEMLLFCIEYLLEHGYPCKALFLENFFKEGSLKEKYLALINKMNLDKYIEIKQVYPKLVNKYLNASKLSLFTSDADGFNRSVMETLLAERPILAYKNTQSFINTLYDKRFFHFYDSQTRDSIGEAALNILKGNNFTNSGSRQYILKEKRLPFMNLDDWVNEIINAFKIIYSRNKEILNEDDLVPIEEINVWENLTITK